MRLSVAMCTYNGARFLGEQLRSIASQERPPDEVVVCDDGSSDETLAVLEQFGREARFPVRIVRNGSNLGYSRNFAQAMEFCTGDAIALSDQDDLWYPGKLARLGAILEGDPRIEGVFSDGDVVDDNSRPVGRTLWRSFRFGLADQARFRSGHAVDALLRRNVVTGMAFAVRRSALDLLQSMPASWIHDGWLAFLIAVRSRLYACPEPLVGYRVHGAQQVGTPPTALGKLRFLKSRGLGAYMARVHERNLDEYERTARQFDELLAYLERSGLGDEHVRAGVRAKAAHAKRGAWALNLSRMKRLPVVLPHVTSYARYSPNGLRAIPRDLMI